MAGSALHDAACRALPRWTAPVAFLCCSILCTRCCSVLCTRQVAHVIVHTHELQRQTPDSRGETPRAGRSFKTQSHETHLVAVAADKLHCWQCGTCSCRRATSSRNKLPEPVCSSHVPVTESVLFLCWQQGGANIPRHTTRCAGAMSRRCWSSERMLLRLASSNCTKDIAREVTGRCEAGERGMKRWGSALM